MRKVRRLLKENWIPIAVGILLTKWAVDYAYRVRGYDAIGSEWLENEVNFEIGFCSHIDILQVRKKIRFTHGAKWKQMRFGLCLRNTKMQKEMDICIRLYSPR